MLYPLNCPAQNYAWGKFGEQSTVAQLLKASNKTVEEKPYAELWVGTHVNGPAKVVGSDEETLLENLLKENKSLQSLDEISPQESGNLPFLFKILSVNKGLSIQAHPDIPLAKRLNAKFPEIYKDDNHKPEMSCAITEFEALCGFQSLESIQKNIESTPELKVLLEDSLSECSVEKDRTAKLEILFTTLMKSDKNLVSEQVNKLKNRLQAEGESIEMPNKLALRLCDEYPGDVGIFCVYFLCYRCLKPGQAVFLGANEPHAYLKGDCAEVMARSDNVVRAGLTPKFRDVDTLCAMLTYSEPDSKDSIHPGNILAPINRDDMTVVYSPPDKNVTEFQLERTVIPAGRAYAPTPSNYGSVILVLDGSASVTFTASDGSNKVSKFTRGSTWFQPAGTQINVETESEDIIYFRTTTKNGIP